MQFSLVGNTDFQLNSYPLLLSLKYNWIIFVSILFVQIYLPIRRINVNNNKTIHKKSFNLKTSVVNKYVRYSKIYVTVLFKQ